MIKNNKIIKSHGDGKFQKNDFAKIGENTIIERGVLIFHPENIELGCNVYVGHNTILKGYYKNKITIGNGTWIGQQCFFHSAGGINIGKNVGIGPKVTILTSCHPNKNIKIPIIHSGLIFGKVIIENDSDIGAGVIILPGIKIGKGVQVGAGAVVTKNIPSFEVWAGIPAKFLKKRK